mgnify:CR=1 FL=1
MKVLCLCKRGNSRSAQLAYILKDIHGINAMAMGIESNGDDILQMLGGWADKIVLVDKTFADRIPKEYRHKLKIWDVGEDRFFLGVHPELMQKYQDYIKNDPL